MLRKISLYFSLHPTRLAVDGSGASWAGPLEARGGDLVAPLLTVDESRVLAVPVLAVPPRAPNGKREGEKNQVDAGGEAERDLIANHGEAVGGEIGKVRSLAETIGARVSARSEALRVNHKCRVPEKGKDKEERAGKEGREARIKKDGNTKNEKQTCENQTEHGVGNGPRAIRGVFVRFVLPVKGESKGRQVHIRRCLAHARVPVKVVPLISNILEVSLAALAAESGKHH